MSITKSDSYNERETLNKNLARKNVISTSTLNTNSKHTFWNFS